MVATTTHFCTFSTVTPVLIIGFCWFFFLIDRSRGQAALMPVSSTLLKSDFKTSEMWKHLLCYGGKSQATMTHPLATMTHI